MSAAALALVDGRADVVLVPFVAGEVPVEAGGVVEPGELQPAAPRAVAMTKTTTYRPMRFTAPSAADQGNPRKSASRLISLSIHACGAI